MAQVRQIRHKREKVRRKQPGNRRIVQVRRKEVQHRASVDGALAVFALPASPGRGWFAGGGGEAVAVSVGYRYAQGARPSGSISRCDSIVHVPLSPVHPSVAPILALQAPISAFPPDLCSGASPALYRTYRRPLVAATVGATASAIPALRIVPVLEPDVDLEYARNLSIRRLMFSLATAQMKLYCLIIASSAFKRFRASSAHRLWT
ncbi:hypothetical protein DFH06DRAFT_1148305 [Mycena polygramma]|nr:hypothetical protein DFH06DRAFT_1148305 [Mycena polygramma]